MMVWTFRKEVTLCFVRDVNVFVNLVSGLMTDASTQEKENATVSLTYKPELTCKILWNYLFIYLFQIYACKRTKVEEKRQVFGNLKNPNGKNLDLGIKIPFAQKNLF